jgi:streptogramin lyase
MPYRRRLEVEALEERLEPSLFGPAQTVLNFGSNITSAAAIVADVTGNGKPDIISITDNAVYVLLLGQVYQSPTITSTPSGNIAVATGHFTHDGKLDVVTMDRFGDLTILLGNGDGTFHPPFQIPGLANAEGAGGPSCLAVGDFTGNGIDDIVTTAFFSDPLQGQISSVNVYLGNGDGTYKAPEVFINSQVWDYSAVAVGDFNGDGKLDIVAGTSPPPFGHTSVPYNALVFLGNGDGTFAAAQGCDPSSQGVLTVTSLAVADFNGDGKEDVALGGWNGLAQNQVHVCLGNGDGTFQNAQSVGWSGASPYWLHIAAGNLDGRVGVVVGDPHASTPGEYVLLGNGDGTLASPEIYSDSQVATVALADINGDGLADLVIDDGSSIAVRMNDYADGFLVTPSAASVTAGSSFSVTVEAVDYQGDPSTDFIGTVHFTSSDPQAGLPADYTFTPADAGVHTFTITLSSGGRQTVTVTDTADPSLNGTADIVNTFSTNGDGQITTGPDGNLWFTAGSAIGKLNPANGAITEFTLSTLAYSITAGPDGNLWFTEPGANDVANINPNNGAITTFAVPTSRCYPGAITAGPDGNVWFTEKFAAKIAKIDPASGHITEYALSSDAQGGITAGSDGNVWFTQGIALAKIDPSTGQITEFPISTAGTGPDQITGGSDGNLWFTDVGLNEIGRISPLTGEINEFPVPARQSNPLQWSLQGITAGPDGNVCFLEEDNEFKDETHIVYNAYVDEITPAGVIGAQFRLPPPLQGNFGLTTGPDRNIWITRYAAIDQLIPRITVSAGAAAQFTFSAPATAGAGTAFNLTVTAKDKYGNVATGYRGTVHFTSTDPAAALPADYPFTSADGGVHTFAVTLNTLGNQSVTVTDSANGLKATTPAIAVVVGPATHFRVTAAAGSTTAGTVLSFTVTALDADNNVATGYTGTVHFGSTDTKAALPAAYTFTAADKGTHKFNITLKTAGSQTVTVSGTDLPGGAVSSWSGDNTTQDRIGGNNGTLQGGASYGPGEVNQAFSFSGTGDYFQAPTNGLPTGSSDRTMELWVKVYAFVTTEAMFASYGTFGSSGQAYGLGTSGSTLFFSDWGTSIFGPSLQTGVWYHVAVTNVGNTATLYLDGVAVASGTLPINTGVGTDIYMGSIPGTVGQIRRLDGLTDELTVYNRALSATEIQGIYLNGSAGKFQTGVGSATVTVNPAAARTLKITGLPATATAGTGVSFTVTVLDVYGNVATGYRGTVHFTSTDPKAVLPANYPFTAADAGTHLFTNKLTFKTAGTQTLTAKDTVTATITGKASEKVVAGAATHFVLTAPATATAGVAFTVTVVAEDAYGNTATGYIGTVHFTSTDPAATLPANYTFTAASAGKHSFSVTLRTTGKQTVTVEDVADPAIDGIATVTV